MAEHASYLNHLKFNPKLEQSWIAKYLLNFRLLVLILILVLGVGIFSFLNLPRRLNPEIKIPIVSVSTVLPGAGPSDVENLVTIPLEDAVRGVEDVKDVTSSSRDSMSIISIEFESGTNPNEAKNRIQSAVDSVSDLPEDALDPNVQKLDFENQPIWQFAVTSKNDDLASLSRFGKDLQKRLEDLSLVDKVQISGLEEQEIQVLIKPESITTYNLNLQQIAGSIKAALSSMPAGIVNTTDSSFSLTIDPTVTKISDLRELQVNLDGQIVKLETIANIQERSKPDQKDSYVASREEEARPALTFSVFKTSTADITKAVDQAKAETEDTFATYPQSFTVQDIQDVSKEIRTEFSHLYRDFLITVSLVFLVLLIFLGSRQAIIASFSIPLSFLIALIVMYATGIAFSFISTFSLLLALGLLVDDTIVVVSAMTSYFRSGKFTPFQTGLLVWRDFSVAIFTTTITTVWAFVPLLLASGIIGEFIRPIPVVVSTTLIASFIVAMFMTMPFMIILLKPSIPYRVKILLRIILFALIVGAFYFLLPKNNLVLVEILAFVAVIFVILQTKSFIFSKLKQIFPKAIQNNSKFLSTGFVNFENFSISYQKLIKNILLSSRNRKLVLVAVTIFSIFSYILVPIGFVKNEFFPKTDEDYIYVSLELPAGTNLEIAKSEAIDLTNKLRKTENLEFMTTVLGQSFNAQNGPGGAENNNMLFTLKLEEKRDHTSSEVAESLRQSLKSYSKGEINIIEASGGPPAGADVQIELLGNDLTQLEQYADQTSEFLKKQSGTTNVQKSIKSGTSKLVFVPDTQKLSRQNIDIGQLGFWMRTYASGFEADKIRLSDDQNEEKSIVLRLNEISPDAKNINTIFIPTQEGNIPLSALGTLELRPNPTLINRKNGKRSITISSAVTAGTVNTEINQKLINYVDKDLNMASGYTWETGGANEENQNSVNSILQAMILSFVLIIITMVLQFRSFRKALIVMLVIPLSISGVFILFALSNTPLSFPALIGVLALFGIVVKNSILVVDKISANEETKMSYVDAIAEGSASRIEAIALTSIATIFGLLPITFSDPLWRGLGGAIIAGLTFSGTIMLFFIPVVYYYWFRPANFKK